MVTMIKKKSHREQVIDYLQTGWFTGFQMCNIIKSSQALARICELKKNPPSGFKVLERIKESADNRCNEYTMVKA